MFCQYCNITIYQCIMIFLWQYINAFKSCIVLSPTLMYPCRRAYCIVLTLTISSSPVFLCIINDVISWTYYQLNACLLTLLATKLTRDFSVSRLLCRHFLLHLRIQSSWVSWVLNCGNDSYTFYTFVTAHTSQTTTVTFYNIRIGHSPLWYYVYI